MKKLNTRYLCFLSLIIACFCLWSCSKPFCPEHCANGSKDGDETGIDCGGGCLTTCTLKKTVLQPGTEGKNTYVQNLYPNGNEGTYSNYVSNWTAGGIPFTSVVFLAFDYRSIPPTANIQKATLTLFADTTSNFHSSTDLAKGHLQYTKTNQWELRQVTAPWDEYMITWNNQPSVSPFVTHLPASTSNNQAYVIDVTNIVIQEFMQGTSHGFKIETTIKNPYNCLVFYSDDSPYASLRPKLEIEYY